MHVTDAFLRQAEAFSFWNKTKLMTPKSLLEWNKICKIIVQLKKLEFFDFAS